MPGPSDERLSAQLAGARAELRGLERDLKRVDEMLLRFGSAEDHGDDPLHALAVVLGPRFVTDGRLYREAIGSLLSQIEELERRLSNDAPAAL